ncbi:MAG: accC [Verrucomicrobiales bacterium]|nr:accC [Verrucomicrobiales bacterium]
MIQKVIIADHGDAAVRLLWQFKRAGVKTVTVYTEEDYGSAHVALGDDSICIGKALRCYITRWDRIISAAEITGANAIHPGDGPLSTDGRFIKVCGEIGLQLLGRNAEQDDFT